MPFSQFSCSFLGETSQLLFNRSYIRQLADDARVMRCKADSTRESNGNRWTPLLLTLYLQVRGVGGWGCMRRRAVGAALRAAQPPVP